MDETFQMCKGIGPVTEARLRASGFRNWHSLLSGDANNIPLSALRLGEVRSELAACQEAYDEKNLKFLTSKLPVREHWRILRSYFGQASYFDIETTGLSPADSVVTIVVCKHRGKLYEFVRGENMDDFLELLDEITLLVSFNGNSFDVPRIMNQFHIPELPCPHVDLRWVSYHRGFRGGLKRIEEELGFGRDSDLKGISGDDAVWLWQKWKLGCDKSKELLLRYCRRDVEALELITQRLLKDVQ
jgi:uncharacterized protein YprB with RNaseH-like and TPR domain